VRIVDINEALLEQQTNDLKAVVGNSSKQELLDEMTLDEGKLGRRCCCGDDVFKLYKGLFEQRHISTCRGFKQNLIVLLKDL